ncbi:taste receptor type 2 member 1-like [Gastrophryne carolinensis]
MDAGGNAKHMLVLMVILVLEVVTGILINGFIVSVVVFDFRKGRTIGGSTKILLCLVFSSSVFNLMITVGLVDYLFGLGMCMVRAATFIYLYLTVLGVSQCAWHTANLGFFYFIKISNFTTGVFSWLKTRVSSAVPWMLLFDFLASLCNSFLGTLLFSSSLDYSGNTTENSLMSVLSHSGSALISSTIAVTLLPFSLLLITTVCSIVILTKHKNKMEKTTPATDTDRLRKIVSRMTHGLLFYIFFYITMTVACFVILAKAHLGFWISMIILSSFCPIQSSILVLTNPRLKDAFQKTFLRAHPES